MSLRIFVSQTTIDTWVATEQVDLAGDVIAIRPSARRLRLSPASFFKSVAGGSRDGQGLVGKVKDDAAIAALGGEAYMTSVVVGEDAYDVEPGFLAREVDDPGDGGRGLLDALARMQH